jgi:hypothetical protein
MPVYTESFESKYRAEVQRGAKGVVRLSGEGLSVVAEGSSAGPDEVQDPREEVGAWVSAGWPGRCQMPEPTSYTSEACLVVVPLHESATLHASPRAGMLEDGLQHWTLRLLRSNFALHLN